MVDVSGHVLKRCTDIPEEMLVLFSPDNPLQLVSSNIGAGENSNSHNSSMKHVPDSEGENSTPTVGLTRAVSVIGTFGYMVRFLKFFQCVMFILFAYEIYRLPR